MLKLACYVLTLLISLATINTYAMSGIGNSAAGGSYSAALLQAFSGGYGNTVPTLIAMVIALVGLLRTWVGYYGGSVAWVAGKALGTVMLLGTFLAVFINGVMVYLKSKPEGGLYIELLGPMYFEIIVCLLLLVGFFAKGAKKSLP